MSFYPIITSGAVQVAYTGTPGSLALDGSQLPGRAVYSLYVTTDAWVAQGIADTVVTATAATDTFTAGASHNLATGMLIQMTAGTSLPTGLSATTNYWVIVTSPTTFKLATTRANALAGTAIDITDAGVGTLTVITIATTGVGSTPIAAKTSVEIDGAFGAKLSIIQDAAGGKAVLTPKAGVR
jgi:hypothetical protein